MRFSFVRNDVKHLPLKNRFSISNKGNQLKSLTARLKLTRSKKTIRHAGQRKGGGNKK